MSCEIEFLGADYEPAKNVNLCNYRTVTGVQRDRAWWIFFRGEKNKQWNFYDWEIVPAGDGKEAALNTLEKTADQIGITKIQIMVMTSPKMRAGLRRWRSNKS